MMDKVKMMADAYKLRKAIEAEVIEIEENGIKITVGGDLKIKKISVNNKKTCKRRKRIHCCMRL